MQRDEFLPLRVIRQELATGDFTGSRRGSEAAATRRAASVEAPVSVLTPGGAARPGRGLRGAAARAPGVRHRPARPPRRKVGLRRDRSRDRPRRGGAVAVRRRRPQSARFRQLGRPRGGAAPAARRPGAAVAQPGSPQGGDREPGEPGGGLRASEASAARTRPPPPQRAEGAAKRRLAVSPIDATGFTKAGDRRARRERVWALVSDPHHLPRWWPRTLRVEDVRQVQGGRRSRWTTVLGTERGTGVRVDYRCTGATQGSATCGSRTSRGRRLRRSCALRRSRSTSRGGTGARW